MVNVNSSHEIKILLLVGKPGVYDGVMVSAVVLHASSRWTLGKPVIARASRVGQINSATWTGQQILCEATIWAQKLSQEQLQALKAVREPVQAIGDFDVIAQAQAGTFGGQPYQKRATSIMWQNVALQLPLKVHSASRLQEIEAAWQKGLGRKDV